MNGISFRQVRPDDAEELLAIYAPYVASTAVSFECTVPTEEEFRRRIETISAEYPYIAALYDGRIAGYSVIGRHENCGYKFGRWYGIVWMEKVISERPSSPEPFIPFPNAQKNKNK